MNEKRLVRICWNTNEWKKPSGKKGKSKSKETFENSKGFGGEEWLFDFDKLIDGYKYGFLQPLWYEDDYRQGAIYSVQGKIYDIGLYSINSINKRYYWIGKILNVVGLYDTEIKEITKIYEEQKWNKDILKDLNAIGLFDYDDKPTEYSFFTDIKFKPSDAILEDKPILINPKEILTRVTRYTFLTENYYPLDFKK